MTFNTVFLVWIMYMCIYTNQASSWSELNKERVNNYSIKKAKRQKCIDILSANDKEKIIKLRNELNRSILQLSITREQELAQNKEYMALRKKRESYNNLNQSQNVDLKDIRIRINEIKKEVNNNLKIAEKVKRVRKTQNELEIIFKDSFRNAESCKNFNSKLFMGIREK